MANFQLDREGGCSILALQILGQAENCGEEEWSRAFLQIWNLASTVTDYGTLGAFASYFLLHCKSGHGMLPSARSNP